MFLQSFPRVVIDCADTMSTVHVINDFADTVSVSWLTTLTLCPCGQRLLRVSVVNDYADTSFVFHLLQILAMEKENISTWNLSYSSLDVRKQTGGGGQARWVECTQLCTLPAPTE